MDHTALVEAKRSVLRALWRDKLHVEKDALAHSPAEVASAYAHVWEPAQVWLEALQALPLGLLRLWAEGARGHLLFASQPSGYAPGVQDWQGQRLEGLCRLSLADVRGNTRRAMWTTLALLDHLLGSQAAPDGPWFSQGAGITPSLRAAAERYVALYSLGYGAEELEAPDAATYFAHSLELYLTLPRRLNVLAPQVYRLYRSTLLRESWWTPRSRVA